MVDKGYVTDVMSSVSLWLTSTLTHSLGDILYSRATRLLIRSDNTSSVAYINPQSGMFSRQLLPLAQRGGKPPACQKLEMDHAH